MIAGTVTNETPGTGTGGEFCPIAPEGNLTLSVSRSSPRLEDDTTEAAITVTAGEVTQTTISYGRTKEDVHGSPVEISERDIDVVAGRTKTTRNVAANTTRNDDDPSIWVH